MKKRNVRLGRVLLLAALFFLGIGIGTAKAQQVKVQGKVSDANGSLVGGSVLVEGTASGGITNADGEFQLSLNPGKYTLRASFVGYSTQKKTIQVLAGKPLKVDFVLNELLELDEVVVLGSRAAPRSRLETAVAVDVIDTKLLKDIPQVNLNQILHYLAPSFNSSTQTISDGTDHIDPASLRGLGPDQVLVLINGKRRHTTSLININGTAGKGSVGTDLNAIPTSAIKRIEILRDGAAAQYGSDAIAGVINIILEDNTEQLRSNLTTGGYLSKNSENTVDGESVQANVNFGLPVGKKGGFINLAGSYDFRNPTNRQKEFTGSIFLDYNRPDLYPNPTGVDITQEELVRQGKTRADYVSRVGQSKNRGGALFVNSVLPVAENAEVYFFGGLNFRNGESAAFRRQPAQLTQNIASIYPDGFLPLINTDNSDRSLSAGIRGKRGKWNIDFSNTIGQNAIDLKTTNSLNASLLAASPTSFEAGGYRFLQNTTNFDVNRVFDVWSGINLAFGAEHRYEKYQIVAGTEDSYRDYGRALVIGEDANGDDILLPDVNGNVSTLFAANGKAYAGGAQAFPGFRPENAVNATRSSVAVYTDAELNFSDSWLLTGALRFENYSDFGSTLNWKTSLRYKLNDNWALRGAASTGFRAPSLHQRYFSATSSVFTDGEIIQSGTFRNDSRVAKLLGIPALKEETSQNYSLGFTGSLGAFKLTVDGYYIKIDNRVIYTGQFKGSNAADATDQDREIYNLLDQAGASTARFFANAIDTETKGVDVVLSHQTSLFGGTLRSDLSGSYVKTAIIGDAHTSDLLAGKESIYLDHASRVYIESVTPRVKANLSLNYNLGRWNVFLRNVYFGEVEAATNTVADYQTYDPKIITDLSTSYAFTKSLRVTVGANNLFDVYPDKNKGSNVGAGYFIYSRTGQQFGFNGRYVFGRLSLTL